VEMVPDEMVDEPVFVVEETVEEETTEDRVTFCVYNERRLPAPMIC